MSSYTEEPRDEFEGLSPRQMQQLFQDFLGPGSIVKLRDDTDSRELLELPLVYFIRQLLEHLAAGEIKLTSKGNLPPKLVKTFYATERLPDRAIAHGATSLRGEDDYRPGQLAKYLPELLRWTKKRHGILSLTERGKEARRLPAGTFFREVFQAHFRNFNLGWADTYPDASEVQHSFPYVAYLLLILGREPRAVGAYSSRLHRALPMVDGELGGDKLERVVSLRLFARFLAYYNFVEVSEDRLPGTVVATEQFYRVFYLDRHARPTPPSEEEEYEHQLRTALSDAEARSWGPADLPPTDPDTLHIRVRDLLKQPQIVPPSAISDGAGAEYAIAVLLQLLDEIHIQTERPDEIEAFPYYAFLHDMLLEHEVVPPQAGEVLYLPFEEIFLEHYRPHERVTEWFLLGLLSLDDPFPQELLAQKMRLSNRMVPRRRVLEHITAWQRQFGEIIPVTFSPLENQGLAVPSEQQAVQLFHLTYEVVYADDGRRETFDGAGVVELLLQGDEWVVTGAQFPGFLL